MNKEIRKDIGEKGLRILRKTAPFMKWKMAEKSEYLKDGDDLIYIEGSFVNINGEEIKMTMSLPAFDNKESFIKLTQDIAFGFDLERKRNVEKFQ